MTPTSVSQILEQAANAAFTLLFAWWMLKIGRQHAALVGLTDPAMIKLYSLQWGAAGSGLGTTAGAVFSAAYLVIFYLRKRGDIRAEAAAEDKSNLARGRAKRKADTLTGQLFTQLVRYAAPITLGAVIVYSANLVDLTFTNMRLSAAGFTDTQAMSLFGILTTQYNKIIGVPLALANTLAVVMLPHISGSAALDDRQALHAKIDNGLRAVFLLTIPSAVILAALAGPLIRLLFPRNVDGIDLMRIGSWVIVLTAMVQLQTSVLQGMGRMQLPVIHMAIALVLKIIVNYTLIGIHSINVRGAVAGTTLCYGVAAVWNYLSIQKISGFKASWRKLLPPPIFASAVMAAVAWGVWLGLDAVLKHVIPFVYWRNIASTLPALLMGGLTYAVALAVFKGISREEILRVPMLQRLVGKQRLENVLDRLRVR